MLPVSPLRHRLGGLVALPLAGAVLTVALGTVALPALAVETSTVPMVEATNTPRPTTSPKPTAKASASPTRAPSPSPTGIVPLPTSTSEPEPSASEEEPSDEPTATATRTRTRTRSPRPQATVEQPVERETPSSPLPAVTGGFEVGSAPPGLIDETPEPTADPTTAPVASSSADTGDKITRLVQLVVAAGVLLGIGGGVGLYLTRT